TRFSRDWSSDVCSSDLGKIIAYAENAQALVLILLDPLRYLAAQNINQVSRTKALAPLAPEPVHRGQDFLCGHGSVPGLRRLKTEIGRASCRDRGASDGV